MLSAIQLRAKEIVVFLQVLPPGPAIETSHIEDTGGKKRTDNIARAERSPEPGEASGKLIGLEKVRKPENSVAIGC
jgi:hypothetical protein